MNTSTQTTQLSAIERALAAAKARKAAKDASDTPDTDRPTTSTPSKPKLEAKVKVVPSDRAEKQARLAEERKARIEARAAKTAANAEARKQKRAEQVATRGPAHMKKVDKAAAKLPKLNETTAKAFADLTSSASPDQLSALALHIQHHNRVAATQRSATVKLQPGDTVKIIGGEPRFLGLTGTIEQARNIRCFVRVDGRKAPVYLFSADVERVGA